MRNWRIALAMGAAPAAFLALAIGLYAQPVVQSALNGQECWNAGQGVGGPSTGALCSNAVAGRTPDVALTVSGSFTVGASGTTGVSVTTQPLQSGGSAIITAQPSVATITMPPNPNSDGMVVRICNGTNSAFATNAVTVAANSGQTMVPTGAAVTLTTLAANTCVAYQFVLANTSWYKVQ